MRVTVVRPGDLSETDRDRWREFQHAVPGLGNPFLAPEFTLAVSRHQPSARVAVLSDDDGLAGFLPFEVRARVIGKAIGSGISDCQALVHRPGLTFSATEILRACRLPLWEYDHLLAGQEPFTAHHTRLAGSPVMDLTDGYAAYLARRSAASDVVSQTLRKQRKMARELGDIRFVWDCRDPAVLSTLAGWKSGQYRRTGQYDRFGTPWIAGVLQDLLASPSPRCRAVVSALYAGDRPVAAHLGLRSRSVLAYWFPAYDPDLGQFSAGVALCLRMAEAAAADGIGHIDLGKGAARYKDSLKTGEIAIAEGMVSLVVPIAAARRAQLAVSTSLRGGPIGARLTSSHVGAVLRSIRSTARRVTGAR